MQAPQQEVHQEDEAVQGVVAACLCAAPAESCEEYQLRYGCEFLSRLDEIGVR